MNKFDDIKGTWVHVSPWDSDDYLAEYIVSGTEGKPVVVARDLNDGEEFIITNAVWREGELSFESLMPSTKRRGANKFSLNKEGKIDTEFTFTVVETLERKNT